MRPDGHCHCDSGPITEECPAECLSQVVSLMALNRVLRGTWEDGTWTTPGTVGDVVKLCRDGKLTSQKFEGLGPRRAAEIRTGLVFAGFQLTPGNGSTQAGSRGQTHR